MTHRQERQVGKQVRADLRPERAGEAGKCKECGERVPKGKRFRSFCCQTLELCWYCYKARFPKREAKGPVLSQGPEFLLSWSERRQLERAGFNTNLWSPAFRRQMQDYWEAKERGELKW